MGKKSDPGSRMDIPDFMFENLVSVFWFIVIKLFDADPDPGSKILAILDGKKWILDKHPGAAVP